MELKEALVEIGRMSIEEKIMRLSDVDKAYVQGYVERAVLEHLKLRQNDHAETLPPMESDTVKNPQKMQ